MEKVSENQFSKPILRNIEKIKKLNWGPVHLIPSSFIFFAHIFLVIVYIILWPYGLFPMIASSIWEEFEESRNEIKGKSFGNAMSHTVGMGIYILFFLPFFMICLPIYTIGFIGKYFSGK